MLLRRLLKRYSPAKLIAITAFLSVLMITGITVVVFSIINKTIEEQNNFATKIDVGGYQRMLSQRIAYYTTEYVNGLNADDRDAAIASIKLLLDRHQTLIAEYQQVSVNRQASLLSDELQTLYFTPPNDLNSTLTEYTILASGLLNGPNAANQRALDQLKIESQVILEKFDRIVQQYKLESNERIRKLSNLQDMTFIVSALLVVVLIVFVIRPLLSVSEALSTKLQLEASKDFLTGVNNRRVFPMLAEQAITMSRRQFLPITVVFFDIDDFKHINDQYGHAAGDEVIRSVAETILSNSRESDETFRFGGDEFVMILPFTDIEGATQVANNIRAHVAKLFKKTPFTLSGGVAMVHDDEDSIEPALKRADRSLYAAKGQAKNRIETANFCSTSD